MRARRPALCRYTTLLIFCCAFLASTALAQVNGALFTTTSTGATVDGNIYMSKSAVYITGGPQNQKDPGLVPDGTYYFQVTDPSGAILLSLDDVSCRQVVVLGGRVVGVPSGSPPATCTDHAYHALGTFNIANGQQPVQLCNPTNCTNDFADTPNPGGEYKAWITPVANYNACSQSNSHIDFGFCDSDSKTDNFKIQKPGTASVTVCKFQDLNDDGTYDPGDPLIPGWPISATGVDSGGPTATGQDGCASYTVSNFSSGTQTVTLSEGTLGAGWTQTAPANTQPGQNCTLTGTFNANDTCMVTGAASFSPPTSGGLITVTVSPDDNVVVPFFGNAFQSQPTLQVSKTAVPSYEYTWGLKKTVNQTEIDDSTGSATFNYTVTVTNNGPSGWMVQGVISVFNPSLMDITGVMVTDSITDSSNNATSCPVTDGTNMTVPAGSTVNFNYSCMLATNPGSGTNTATATWSGGSQTGMANYDFAQAMIADNSVTITDSLAGTLGTVSIDPTTNSLTTTPNAANPLGVTSSGPGVFNYSYTFNGDPSGTCTSHNNTATFTADSTNTTGSSMVSVKQCVGADPQVSKSATAGFNSSVSKSANKTTVQQSGGNITFNYTVSVTESAWTVTGYITVTNPNDWEPLTVNVTDLIDNGGTCVVTGGTGVVLAAKGSSGPLAYSCSYSTNPTLASGINSGYAAVTSGITAHASVSGTAMYSFNTLTITDTQNGCTTTLGTVSVTTTTPNATPGCSLTSLKSPSFGVFTYSWTVANSNPGTCSSYNDTAQITGGSSSNQVTVTVCNTNTGALTMGFWKNSNGQKIINAGASTGGVCNLGTWLRILNPFQDLSSSASCKQVATYVNNTISAATCGGNTCNAMLKSQMLATALDVYFSTVGLGGNQIGAYNGLGTKTPALGSVAIDLSHICSMADGTSSSTCSNVFEDARPEFGILSPCLGTMVSSMLSYADFTSATNGSPVSNAGGTTWYKQIKNPNQVYAKDGFDNVNNQVANIDAGTVCSPSF